MTARVTLTLMLAFVLGVWVGMQRAWCGETVTIASGHRYGEAGDFMNVELHEPRIGWFCRSEAGARAAALEWYEQQGDTVRYKRGLR